MRIRDPARGTEEDLSLKEKIDSFVEAMNIPVDIVNIGDFQFKGSCQGCFNCAATGECIYKDGFTDLLRNNIHKHDAIVYAFTIRNHSMGSRFKVYDDRQFCNGHRTVTMGTPFGYIIEGDIESEPNLKKVLTARAQVGGMKIFRDLIYQMRGMMRADHKFFKANGQYDFPQKKWATSMKMYLVGWMMNSRKIRSRLGNKLNEGMVAPYKDL